MRITFDKAKPFTPPRQEKKNQIRGLGDVVHKFAEPIKEAIMKYAPETIKKKMENCNCEKRRQKLNELFPMNSKSPK